MLQKLTHFIWLQEKIETQPLEHEDTVDTADELGVPSVPPVATPIISSETVEKDTEGSSHVDNVQEETPTITREMEDHPVVYPVIETPPNETDHRKSLEEFSVPVAEDSVPSVDLIQFEDNAVINESESGMKNPDIVTEQALTDTPIPVQLTDTPIQVVANEEIPSAPVIIESDIKYPRLDSLLEGWSKRKSSVQVVFFFVWWM